jgi:hypothetical protein
MPRTALLRLLAIALALVHTFPARKHLAAFFETPSLTEAWEGFGALLAIVLYLLPVRVQVRALATLWREHRVLLRSCGLVLAAAHAVPAFDHLPRFFDSFSWHDAWRGIGSALAVMWFLLPVRVQAGLIGALGRLARVPEPASVVERVTGGRGAGPSDQIGRRRTSPDSPPRTPGREQREPGLSCP